MASAFTHMLVGAAAAQLLPAELPRKRIAVALAIAAAAPDLDVVAFSLNIPYGHPLGHRGFSHSLLAALCFGAVVAFAATWDRQLVRRWAGRLTLAGFLAVASHGLLDAATTGGRGIGFFVPFSNRRYFLPWRPIEVASVDPLQFFSARGLEILRSEIVWVWLPLLVVSLAGALVRYFLRTAGSLPPGPVEH